MYLLIIINKIANNLNDLGVMSYCDETTVVKNSQTIYINVNAGLVSRTCL